MYVKTYITNNLVILFFVNNRQIQKNEQYLFRNLHISSIINQKPQFQQPICTMLF